MRQLRAELRRMEILNFLAESHMSLLVRGTQRALAERFGVSEATISRDLVGIYAEDRFARRSGGSQCQLSWRQMRVAMSPLQPPILCQMMGQVQRPCHALTCRGRMMNKEGAVFKGAKLIALVGATVLAVSTCVVSAAGASPPAAAPGPQPLYTVLPPTPSSAALPARVGLQMWTYQLHVKGVAYPEQFVGTSPAHDLTTIIPTVIIPIELKRGTFVANPSTALANGLSVVQNTVASPIFQSSVDFVQGGTNLGTLQYVDAYQRAALWRTASTEVNYHVALGQPTIRPTQVVAVPGTQGTVETAFGQQVIVANINWYDSVIKPMLTSLKIPTNVLPIFVTTQTYLSDGTPPNVLSGCCIGGYHSAAAGQPYIQFSYSQLAGAFAEDVSALSHEVAETYNDPLADNAAPPACGAGALYEVGDPLEGDAN